MLTDRERDVMRHALGLTRARKSYRNHFVASQGGPDAAIWDGLCARGFADRTAYPHAPSSVFYWVTDAGRAALSHSQEGNTDGC